MSLLRNTYPLLRPSKVSATLLKGVQGFFLTDCPRSLAEVKEFAEEVCDCARAFVCITVGKMKVGFFHLYKLYLYVCNF